jgi:hypothetical protein
MYFGDIARKEDEYLIEACRRRRRHQNVMLFITTFGGDPNVAYRIARCFQRTYETIGQEASRSAGTPERKKVGNFYVCVMGMCKSAGTILTLGSDKLFMSDLGELGPIDVQLRKPDEVGERTSGLTPIQALQFLETQSRQLFDRHFKYLRFSDDLIFSTKMAAELATNITVGLLKPIYEQIDPIRLAEVDRSLKISSEYGERIGLNNLKEGALERLLVRYPSHGFVIDRREARDLFQNVAKPCEKLEELYRRFRPLADIALEGGERFVYFVSQEPPEEVPEGHDHPEEESSGEDPERGQKPETSDIVQSTVDGGPDVDREA